MARKTNSATGEVADKRISVVVTNSLREKILVLADVKFGGSVNALVTELLERAAENDAAIITEGLLARKSYATRINNIKSKFGLAQDTTSGESSNAENPTTGETPRADEIPVKTPAKKKKNSSKNNPAAPDINVAEGVNEE